MSITTTLRAAVTALAVALLVGGAGASAAQADYGVFGFSTTLTDTTGAPVTQAASHPDFTVRFQVNRIADPNGGPAFDDGQTRDVVVDLPDGMYGNPTAVPTCPRALLIAGVASGCSLDTAIGELALQTGEDPTDPSSYFAVPLFNVAPGDDEAAAFGADFLASPVGMVSTVTNDGRPHVRVVLHNVNQGVRYYGVRMTIWGVPADASHDTSRGGPSGATRAAFLTAPDDCAEPLVTRLRASSWQDRTRTVEATATMPAPTGCDRLALTHGLAVRPAEARAHAPSGYTVELTVPQDDAADGLGTPSVRSVRLGFPDGATLSPSSAVGLEACPDATLGVGDDTDPSCPPASRIGDVRITTPLLAKDLEGDVFVGAPTADARFRVFVVARGPGVVLKLRGTLSPDPATGRLTATFDDLPDLPFSHMVMNIKGGPGAPLITPSTCGTSTATSVVTGWSGATSSADDGFAVTQGCDGGRSFAPTFTAGTLSARAGAASPFTMAVRRTDADQPLSAIALTLPAGLLGRLAKVPRCAEVAAVAGSCPAESQLGAITVESGVGPRPLALGGRVYLAGPYKGAPFSLVFVVPAVAGPYDLGTVIVRAQLRVDPVDAHVTVLSDPLPTILAGVPLDVRTVAVTIDRPGFMVSPTRCAPLRITGTAVSTAGVAAPLGTPFRVQDCGALGLTPRLALALSGKGQTTDGKHPSLTATLRQPGGQANLGRVTVTLPLSLALDTNNSQSDALCEFVTGQRTVPACPSSSVVGTAIVRTPALDQPLSGPVYFVKNVRTSSTGRQIRTLPTLAVVLRAEGVTLVLRATTAVVDDHLVTTFAGIPDAPVSSFTLALRGGAKGILVVSNANLCKSTQAASARLTGQNGAAVDRTIPMRTPCALGVVGARHTPSALDVTVGGLGAGRVVLTGGGIARATRAIRSATTATVRARLDRTARRRLAGGHDVRTRVTVAFTPAAGKRARVVRKLLTIHGS